MTRPDILLSHGYHVWQDPHERATMRPYPPLGILYLAGWLQRAGVSVQVHDTTFARADRFGRELARHRPRVVGLYANMLTRRSVLEKIKATKITCPWRLPTETVSTNTKTSVC